jgi:DNA-binding transcriptional regulator YdaS (Cro superfamily)
MAATHVLDHVAQLKNCKNDAALARLLDVAPPVVSKWRHARLPMGATHILRIHELEPNLLPVSDIRQLLAA